MADRRPYPHSYRGADLERVSCEWYTPDWILRGLELEFGAFDLDPCAAPGRGKAPRAYSREDDGLSQPWAGRVFLNPPYGDLAPWLHKARLAAASGAALVVALLPVRTDARWWHDHVLAPGVEVRYIQGRVGFDQPDGSTRNTPFASAIVIYRPFTGSGLDKPSRRRG